MTPRVKPVYNVGDYGEDVFLPLTFGSNSTTTISIQSVTASAAATEIRTALDGTAIPIDDNDLVLMLNDTLGLLNQGDDTAFSQTFTWTPDMTATIYKTSLQIAYGVNVSAFTNGTVNLGVLKIKAVERATGRLLIQEMSFPQINSALTATGCTISILLADYTDFYEVKSKSPIDITITTAAIKTGTNTRQEGILPVFCWTKTNIVKPFSVSGIKFHVHASVNHADPVFALNENRIEQ